MVKISQIPNARQSEKSQHSAEAKKVAYRCVIFKVTQINVPRLLVYRLVAIARLVVGTHSYPITQNAANRVPLLLLNQSLSIRL